MSGTAPDRERRWLPRFFAVGALRIPYVSRAKAIASIDSAFRDRRRLDVTFCNAHTMQLALRSTAYNEQLGRFLVLNDGIGVDLAARLCGAGAFAENLNGTDFVPDLLARTAHRLRIVLIGSRPGVAETAALEIARRFPQHVVVGTHDGFLDGVDVPALIAAVNAARPDLVLVGMGNPLQERFIATWRAHLDATVIIGVGALFDFIAGAVPRAPYWMRRMRLEWLFRLLQEPHRLGRRYTVGIVLFFAGILRLRFWALGGGMEVALIEDSPSRLRLLPSADRCDAERTAA